MSSLRASLRVACAICIAASSSQLLARHTADAQVRYATEKGASKWYRVEVNFLTGTELTNATGSWSYSPFEHYAVIFWAPGEATVIELDDLIICGSEFEESCLPIFGRMKGKDQQKRSWDVCTAWIC